MRKFYYYLLLTFIIAGCDNKEELPSTSQSIKNPTQTYIINGDIEYVSEITDGSKPKKPIFIYDIPEKTKDNANSENTTYKTSEHTVSINFGYPPTHPSNSGCTVKRYNNGNSYYTDSGVYGINPYPYPTSEGKSCLVRGFGAPHHNLYYGSLILFVSNKGIKSTNRYNITTNKNDVRATAMSIEYPFNKNTTYEITLRTTFYDNRYLIDKVNSSGFPTLYVQLKDEGNIPLSYRDLDLCEGKTLNDIGLYSGIGLYSNDNYTRTYSPNSVAATTKDISFYFSPTDDKKALLISLHPALGSEGYNMPIPTNNHTLVLPLVKITEKPFDPSLNFEIKPDKRR